MGKARKVRKSKRGGKIGGPKREVWKGSAPKLNLFNGRKYFDDATEFV